MLDTLDMKVQSFKVIIRISYLIFSSFSKWEPYNLKWPNASLEIPATYI